MGVVLRCIICFPYSNTNPRIRQVGIEARCPIHYDENQKRNRKEVHNDSAIQKKIRKQLPPGMKFAYKKKLK